MNEIDNNVRVKLEAVSGTPATHLTLDLQVVNSPQERLETATVLGLRASLEF
jgi:hypothetical protein